MPRRRRRKSQARTVTFEEGLGRAIKVLRTYQDLSRKDLADRAGLSYSYLAEIETGKKSPSSKALIMLARALAMDPSELMQAAESWRTGAPEAGSPRSQLGQAAAGRSPSPLFGVGALAAELAPSERVAEDELSAYRDEPSATARAGDEFDFEYRSQLHDLEVRGPAEDRDGDWSIPDALVEQIQAGRCVAFVGAGFSAAADFPGWGDLLVQVAEGEAVRAETRDHVVTRVEQGSASALDEAAQVLEDELGRERLLARLAHALSEPDPPAVMARRIELLHGIPFRAILTTNFDGLLRGPTPSHEAYRQALRPESYRWWEPQYWGGAGAFTLKLHGDLAQATSAADSVVLTRRDYRRRLYDDPAYTTFLRAVMATSTVLYLGFSFEDAYLNELRSEILALLGQQQQSAPVAYALVNDMPSDSTRHFRRHEGIEILSYDSQGGSDFSGFDRYLEELHDATSPLLRFARYLAHKRILWVDPHPQNNEAAFAYLAQAARLAKRESSLVMVDTADEGLREIESARPGARYDLVISHWGDGAAEDDGGKAIPTAERLLRGIRERDLQCPVVIFASQGDADRRKRIALGLGAQDYCFKFESLYQTIERILAPAEETG